MKLLLKITLWSAILLEVKTCYLLNQLLVHHYALYFIVILHGLILKLPSQNFECRFDKIIVLVMLHVILFAAYLLTILLFDWCLIDIWLFFEWCYSALLLLLLFCSFIVDIWMKSGNHRFRTKVFWNNQGWRTSCLECLQQRM